MPFAPAGFDATAGDGEVTLAWDNPGDDTITEYQYRWSEDGGGIWNRDWTEIPGSGPTTVEYVVTGLTPGTTYTFEIRAVNPEGNGAESDQVSATPFTVPGAPRNVAAAPLDRSARLTWEAPASDGGAPITGYEYRVTQPGSSEGVGWQTVSGSDVDTRSYEVPGLTNGQPYTLLVRAVNEAGPGADAAAPSVTPYTVPGNPLSFSAIPGDGAVDLSWVAALDNGAAITGYQYQQKEGDGNFGDWIDIPDSAPDSAPDGANAVLYRVPSLTYTFRGNGVAYTFRLRAVNVAGAGAGVEAGAVTPAGLPLTPTGFGAAGGVESAILSWTVADDNGSTITGYQYQQRKGSDSYGQWSDIPGSGPTTVSYTVTGLTAGAGYTFRIRAVNVGGTGVESGEAGVTLAAIPVGTTELWSADLTVAESSDAAFRGYRRGDHGTLSNTTFTYEGATYTVIVVTWERESADNLLRLAFEPAVPNGLIKNRLVLKIGDTYFNSGESDITTGGARASNTAIWPTSAIAFASDTWDVGTEVAVALYEIPLTLTLSTDSTTVSEDPPDPLPNNAPANPGQNVRVTVTVLPEPQVGVRYTGCGLRAADSSTTPYTADSADYSIPTATKAIRDADTPTWTKSFNFWIIDDQEVDPGETLVIEAYCTGASDDAPPKAAADLLTTQLTFTINDNELAAQVVNSQPYFDDSDSTSRTIAENADAGANVGAAVAATDSENDILTYSISGVDAGSFTIDATNGQLKTSAALDHETKPSYTVTVSVHDGANAAGEVDTSADDTIMVTINVTDVDEPPDVSGQTSVDYAENGAASVATYTARDPEGQTGITWTLAGDDSGDFTLTGGVLSFDSPPNYEDPQDADVNNAYLVTIAATDASSNSSSLEVTVSVTDVDERGSVALNSDQPQVGTELTATLTDPDGPVSVATWQWARSSDGSTNWVDIAGGTSVSYTPVDADLNHYLRATATYDDIHGTGKSVPAIFANWVSASPDSLAKPTGLTATSGDGSVTLSWTDPEDSTITGWEYTVDGGSQWHDMAGAGASTTSYTVRGLRNGTEYTFSIRVKTTSVSGPASDSVVSTAGGGVVIFGPLTMTVGTSPAGHKGFVEYAGTRYGSFGTVSERTFSYGGTSFELYSLFLNSNGESLQLFFDNTAEQVNELNGITLRLGNGRYLLNEQLERSSFGSLNSVIWSSGDVAMPDWSDGEAVSVSLFDSTAMLPAKPEGFRVFHDDGKVILQWDDPADSTIKRYQMKQDDADWVDLPGGASITSHEVTGLVNGTEYIFSLRAVNVMGSGEASDPFQVTPALVPRAPVNLRVEPGDGSVTLRWEIPEGPGATKWQVNWRDLNWTGWTDVAGDGTAVSHVVSGLTNGHMHEFAVRGSNSHGTGPVAEVFGMPVAPRPPPPVLIEGADWCENGVVVEDPANNAALISDCEALLQFEAGVYSEYGFDLEWINDDPEFATSIDTWEGVTVQEVDGVKRVVAIDLYDYALSGSISASLGELSKLTRLDLGYNNLSEGIPDELADLSELMVLILSDNDLIGPYSAVLREFFEGLESLDLSGNPFLLPAGPESLSGTIGDGSVTLAWEDLADESVTKYQVQQDDGEWTDIAGSDAAATDYTVSGLNNGQRYSFRVRAVNAAGDGDESELVDATPAANIAPEFPTDVATRSIPENTAANTNIGEPVTATDTDVLTYSLSGTDHSSFSIVSSTGQLQTKAALDYESKNSYAVVVTAADPSGATDTIAVTINVTDVDEPPDVSGQTAVDYAENGTGAVATYTASDPEGQTGITWTLAGADSGDFSISTAGVLTFDSPPNYEDRQDADNAYQVTVRASDGTVTGALDVTITVTNVDEAGVVSLSPAQPQVGTALNATLTDPDGPVSVATWQWARSSDGSTNWGDITGATSASYTPVDGDVDNYLRATASYTDPEGSGKSAQAVSVNRVQAAPVVNTAPAFPTDMTTRSIAENTATGTNIGAAVTATDTDTLTYSLSGTDAGSFDIVSTSGQLQTKAALDYERKNSYEIVVTAADPFGATDTITVTINVTDVDKPPDVSGQTAVDYAENGTGAVATYTASDPEGQTGITWTLAGADSGDFSITDGVLSFNASPNYEDRQDADANNAYQVTVRASDGTVTGALDVTITVTNVDEAGVVSLSPSQPQVGTALNATLTDPDGTISATTWVWASSSDWDVSTQTGTWTDINGATSASYTPVDGDVDDYLRATASYTDPEGSGKSAQVVSVNRVQAAPVVNTAPAFAADNAARAVDENAAVGANVGDPVTATDADATDRLTYSLSGTDAGSFDIVSTSGQMHREATSWTTRAGIPMVVTAADPSGATDTITVTINVTNVDEAPDVSGQTAVDYAENWPRTRPADPEGTNRHHLDAGWRRQRRLLHQHCCAELQRLANYEDRQDADANNAYQVTVRASDGTVTGALDVTITVTNVDETGVVSLSPSQPQVGTALNATLTDPDGSVSGVTWVWESSPNNSTWTAISGATAESYTPVDADVDNYLRATASYTDPQGAGKSAQAVSVNQVQAAPVINLHPIFSDGTTTTRSVAENSPQGTNVGTAVSATDADSLTYSLSGADQTSFDIVSTNGQITVRSGTSLDYESRNSYAVVVTAADPSGATDTIAVTVNVTNVDETGVVSLSPSQPQVGTELTATLTDPDGTISTTTWVWASSSDWDATAETGTWSVITGATRRATRRWTPT